MRTSWSYGVRFPTRDLISDPGQSPSATVIITTRAVGRKSCNVWTLKFTASMSDEAEFLMTGGELAIITFAGKDATEEFNMPLGCTLGWMLSPFPRCLISMETLLKKTIFRFQNQSPYLIYIKILPKSGFRSFPPRIKSS